ncbi:unnamed protein product [Tetraodon nigroviridis]|uniref:(spotted green pufferfish) hypothetical protein n=1 Tax=Tetraodon nigroviridis TaxID=99883 RepID=Q4SXP9_TETNG|nr:unnamed protein product [Tetraodon nigroviridis]
MDPRWCPVLLAALAGSLCSAPALAERKFGCLFEDELCASYEFCVNDGVFGRCEELAAADLGTHQLSSSALQRLRTLLEKLAQKGRAACLSAPSVCLHRPSVCTACPCPSVFLPPDGPGTARQRSRGYNQPKKSSCLFGEERR